ncbi:hypothetical protein [Halomicrobium mukohataei]|uniref:hypothetical protein n=1 Tax=Halomicrobium mukohataei TaxID=57705 RepID=UPI000F8CDE53|nr:hypothetical protein [Halomicrobium mukohataei]
MRTWFTESGPSNDILEELPWDLEDLNLEIRKYETELGITGKQLGKLEEEFEEMIDAAESASEPGRLKKYRKARTILREFEQQKAKYVELFEEYVMLCIVKNTAVYLDNNDYRSLADVGLSEYDEFKAEMAEELRDDLDDHQTFETQFERELDGGAIPDRTDSQDTILDGVAESIEELDWDTYDRTSHEQSEPQIFEDVAGMVFSESILNELSFCSSEADC